MSGQNLDKKQNQVWRAVQSYGPRCSRFQQTKIICTDERSRARQLMPKKRCRSNEIDSERTQDFEPVCDAESGSSAFQTLSVLRLNIDTLLSKHPMMSSDIGLQTSQPASYASSQCHHIAWQSRNLRLKASSHPDDLENFLTCELPIVKNVGHFKQGLQVSTAEHVERCWILNETEAASITTSVS
eukprot:263977-Rhodomonas_salina.3